jgi:PAS domain S-box-containing protein
VTRSGFVRRRQAGVLLVGAMEPEVQPWLRAAGHAIRSVRDAESAMAALEEEPADLLVVDRESGALDAAGVCRKLREEGGVEDAWLLAITVAAKGRMADSVLDAGADDYLHRPFSRAELLARARAGLRAAQQRSDDSLLRALMLNVPGAMYRSAWHDGHTLELISDEIERISGYPPANFIASRRRNLLSIIHPDDRDAVLEAVAKCTATRRPLAVEYRIRRADGETRWVLDRGQLVDGPGGRLWMDGALFDITERRNAEEALRRREIEEARMAELRASRARIVDAADAARRKIERDLHDGAQQRLVSMALEVRIARGRAEREPASAAPFLEHLGEELSEASAELRELARGIHPAVLTERGLAPAIAALAARAPFLVEILELPDDRLPSVVETTAYFTVSEALTNVAKYAEAGRATVRLAQEDDALVIEVQDDGIGGARASTGSGLSGLTDRLGACDGTLTVHSPPGEGTLVRGVLPLADQEPAESRRDAAPPLPTRG